MRNLFVPVYCLAVMLFSLAVVGRAAAAPFYSRNLGPLVQIYGLPAAAGAELQRAGDVSVRLAVNVANNFSRDAVGNEDVLLDGETGRVDMVLRYGVTDRLELGFDLPYVYHSGGIFDSFIDSWHDSFGLPDGGRPSVASDRINYRYQRNGVTLLDIAESSSGIGDLSITAGWRLYGKGLAEGGRQASLQLGVKLPTGDSRHLLGSGAADISLALALSDDRLLDRKLFLYGMGGMLFVGEGDVLPTLQRSLVGFATLGGSLRLNSRLVFKAQVDTHSPFYQDSDLRQLGAWSAQLLVGGAIDLPGDTVLELGVAEDIGVDTAPDIVFHLGLSRKF